MAYLKNLLAAIQGRTPAPAVPATQSVALERAYTGDHVRRMVPDEQRRGVRTHQVPTGFRWLPQDLDGVLEETESGTFYRLASLCRGMRSNGTIAGLLGQRESIVRLPFVFTGDPWLCDELRGVPAKYTPDGVMVDPGVPGSFAAMVPDESLRELIGTGALAGACPFELVDCGGPDPVLEPRDLHFLRFDWGTREHVYQGSEATYRVRPGNGRWGLYSPGGRERWWAGGAWWPLAWPFVASLGAGFDRARWQALLTDPVRYVRAGDGAKEEDVAAMQYFVDHVWGRAPGLVLPKGWDVGYAENNATGWEVFRDAEADADKAIRMTLSGNTDSAGGGTAFSNSSVFDAIHETMISATASSLARCLSEQVIAPWAWRRYGVPPDRAPKLVWDVRSPTRRKADAELLSAMADAVMKADAMYRPRGMMVDVATYFAKNAIDIPVMPIGGISASPSIVLASPRDAEVLDDADVVEDVEPDDAEPLDNDHAARLAAEMTEHGVDRCEHGKANRCRICGIERVRGVVPSTKRGQPHGWRVAWKAINKPAPRLLSAGTVSVSDEIDVDVEGVTDAA